MTKDRQKNKNQTCRICGSDNISGTYKVRETMLGLGDEFLYVQCGNCGCLQISDIPDNMERYYPPYYYSFSSSYREHTSSPLIQQMERLRNRSTILPKGLYGKLISLIFPNKKLESLSRLPINLSSSILDVGCGSGWRIYALREAGFVNVLGIDPYIKQDIACENGLRIMKKRINDMDGIWDVIMFHHSFEHVQDPIETILKTAELLAPGGVCLIRMPTVDSFAWERYRQHWYQIDAPRHYHIFSKKSMALLAAKAGLFVNDIVYDSTRDQFWKSELNLGQSKLIRRYSWIKKRAWAWKAKRLNMAGRGDQAAFYLIKK